MRNRSDPLLEDVRESITYTSAGVKKKAPKRGAKKRNKQIGIEQ